jgi:hypothetical protein
MPNVIVRTGQQQKSGKSSPGVTASCQRLGGVLGWQSRGVLGAFLESFAVIAAAIDATIPVVTYVAVSALRQRSALIPPSAETSR